MKLAIPLLLLVSIASAQDPLERALLDPPATGLLVLRVENGSQAAERGIRVGDVLVSYDGTALADLDALRAAMGAATGKAAIPCVLVRAGDGKIEIDLVPGRIGVSLSPVVKGQPPSPLPPETEFDFDFSTLADGKVHEEWLGFYLADSTVKAGYEHATVRIEDGKLVVRREVAFDGAEQYGLQHFDVTVTAVAGARPIPVALRFFTPLTKWVGEGELVLREGGTRIWRMTSKLPDQEAQTSESVSPDRLPLVPTYLVETLAAYLPRTAGTCFHFRPVEDGSGQLLFPSALFVVGEEEVTMPDATKVKAWRIEHRRLGGVTAGTFWVDGEGRKVAADFGGGARSYRSTKKAALEGVRPELKPQAGG